MAGRRASRLGGGLGLERLQPVHLRLEVIEGGNDAALLRQRRREHLIVPARRVEFGCDVLAAGVGFCPGRHRGPDLAL